MKIHRRWWTVPVIMITLIVSVCFWPTLNVYLAPKTVLSSALMDTYSQLKQRVQNSPIVLIGNTLDFTNGNTIDLHLDKQDALLDSVVYDMTIATKWNPKQLAVQGAVTTKGKSLDLSVYMDAEFAALSSAGMLGGNFYGLTYKTFPQDIRANQFISLVCGEDVLQDWEADVKMLQSFMAKNYALPSIAEADLQAMLVGILALKAEVDRETMDVNGAPEACFVISFETTGSAITSSLDYLNMELPIHFAPDEEVDVAFWLWENSVIKLEIEGDNREVELVLGPKPASDDISLRYEKAGEVLTILISTQQNDSEYRETITITGSESRQIGYNWNLDNGDLLLNTDPEGEGQTIFVNFSPVENGFILETGDFEALMHVIAGLEDLKDSPCNMTVTKGADITTPTYKNFSEWSLEDLITLFAGFGSLIGLEIG